MFLRSRGGAGWYIARLRLCQSEGTKDMTCSAFLMFHGFFFCFVQPCLRFPDLCLHEGCRASAGQHQACNRTQK